MYMTKKPIKQNLIYSFYYSGVNKVSKARAISPKKWKIKVYYRTEKQSTPH